MRCFIGLCFAAGLAYAQKPDPETVIQSNVREVVLDVIVRHKDMSLDRKLKASDFTVTEDGVAQQIRAFRFVGGRSASMIPGKGSAARTAGVAAVSNSLHEPNFVSIVFGDMGPDSRRNALAAATDFLDQEFRDATYAAVFSLGLRLNAIHGFTNNRVALAQAVKTAAGGTSMEMASATAGVLNQTTYSTSAGPGGISLGPSVDPAQTPDLATSGAASAPLSEGQQAIASMVSAQRDMVTGVEGMQVMTALLRLVEYESKLPGRKTVLYLSEGLTKPPNRDDMMRNVIGAANRGNISFYCLDVRGLTAETSNGTSSGLLSSAAGLAATQGTMSSSPAGAKAQAGEFDVIAESLAAHVQLNMAELAEGTGGFAVFSTNDFKKAMTRVMEDVRTHYEISYVPSSEVYDGHFRQIKVSLHDPKLTVQSREGYFAVPDVNGVSIFPYELEGLKALGAGAPRHDFEFHAAALRYKPTENGFRYEMAFDLDTSNLTTKVSPATHSARIHGTFLALIKAPSGQIVSKVSQELDRDVPEEKLEQFRRGQIVFTSAFEMAAGRYTIDAVVTDPEGNRAATKRMSLVVPKPGAPAVSSVTLVREIDPLTAPRDPGNPLEFAGGKVLPALEPNGGDAVGTALFFVVYPELNAEKPKVTVRFFRDGAEVSRGEPDPGKPDEVNSMPILTQVKLPPGEYSARVTVQQGGRTSAEALAVSVKAPESDRR